MGDPCIWFGSKCLLTFSWKRHHGNKKECKQNSTNSWFPSKWRDVADYLTKHGYQYHLEEFAWSYPKHNNFINLYNINKINNRLWRWVLGNLLSFCIPNFFHPMCAYKLNLLAPQEDKRFSWSFTTTTTTTKTKKLQKTLAMQYEWPAL